MFSTIVEELKGYLGREFLLAFLVPVLFFAGSSLALYYEVTLGLKNAFAALESFSILTQTIVLICFLAGVTTIAYLLYNLQYIITRLYEGYWFKIYPFEWLREARIEYYKQWSRNLRDQADELSKNADTIHQANEIMGELLALCPPPTHTNKTMPTRIGNILVAAEVYAYDRYGIESQVIWPRLRPLLKPEVMVPLDYRRTTLNFTLLMSLLTAVFTPIWCLTLAFGTTRWGLFFLCSLFGWVFEYIVYRNAIQSALAYGEQLKATFDLYRHDLLRALNIPIPATAQLERQVWINLKRFYNNNVPLPYTSTANKTHQQ
jgi:hypothetical protein